MAGSFTNLIYDQDAYAVDLKQSTAPLNWNLDPNYSNSCSPCFAGDVGYIGRQGVSMSADHSLIDVESNLRLMNYRNSNNPAMKFQPHCQNPQSGGAWQYGGAAPLAGVAQNQGYPGGGGIAPNLCHQNNDCQDNKFNYSDCKNLYTDYARLTNPPCTLRGTGWNRFQPMCLNFQDENRWLHPGKVGINYRMVVKDNHRPKIPVPLDQTAGLPDPDAPEPNTTPRSPDGCVGVFLAPMHEYYVNLLTTPYQGMDC